MSAINGKKVTSAVLLTNGIFIQGFGTTRSTLSSVDDGINKAANMTIDEPFLIVELTHPQTKAPLVVPVPLTNFSHLVLAK